VKRQTLWTLSIATTSEAEDAVAALLRSRFPGPASSYLDVETGEVLVSVYLPEPPRRFHEALRAGLNRIRQCGLKPGAGTVSVRRLRHRDWAESWKSHFQPIQIGSTLLLRPGWSRRRPKKGQRVVVLDPGLSFGTGQHPTTGFCLRQLARRRNGGAAQSFLDIGTGSGILAIAAAKLGYAPVDAFDCDPDAVRMARANARRNRVRIRVISADLTRLSTRAARRYDLICANLITPLLVSQRQRIISRLKSGGTLVLAGILETEFANVARAYRHAGLNLVVSRREKEWRSGVFVPARASP
jgi:ribosomal protein L11 methyltransferase